jgi:natural product biosynthesis luciferase-like monooxygenase protein
VVAAVAAWHRRTLSAPEAVFSVTDATTRASAAALAPLVFDPLVRIAVDHDTSFQTLRRAAREQCTAALERGPFLRDLVGRDPALRGTSLTTHVAVDTGDAAATAPFVDAMVRIATAGDRLVVRGPVDRAALDRFADQLVVLLAAGLAAPATPMGELPLLGDRERAELDAINDTVIEFDRTATVDRLFRDQVGRTPVAPALTAGGRTLTYEQLARRVDAVAAQLADAGVGRHARVGIAVERSADMVVAVLATHACGAAYVPLDPTYPPDRIALMIGDSGLRVIVAEPGNPVVVGAPADVVVVNPTSSDAVAVAGSVLAPEERAADDLAYVIYTSGSTGTPKGVMLEHRNVVNFFAAMDAVIDHDPPGVWLAVTSLSFDISVLELLWTLTRGFHVVVKPDSGTKAMRRASSSARPLTMSLFYFAAGEETAGDGYRLLLESARWADARGFEAVWTPERHFHAFGGAYPNPSVIGAAIAAVTDRIRIRAGSVVAPLHSPARIAEEWAVVDNLSRGRVDISFAAGWQPNDFVLNPEAFATARDSLPAIVDTVRRLWRGEAVDMPGPNGTSVPVRTLPRPVQPELPVWLTSAGSTSTFERAGGMGVNLLTHLLGQSVEQLAENIAAYRRAWREAGHAGQGHVTLMLHTYLHENADEARRLARDPMKRYLGTAAGLLKNMASAFPIFAGSGKDADEAFASLTADEMDQLLDMAADRYLHTSGLFGTVDDAIAMLDRCGDAGADEIACLVDFGVDTDAVLGSLPLLGAVHDHVLARRSDDAPASTGADALSVSFADLVAAHGVTHLQCTPSLATMIVADPADRAALATIGHVMLGGEALPTALASDLVEMLPGRLTNMYGPTETTIWSLVHEVADVPPGGIPIGRPIGNNTVFVLDPAGRRLPIGAYGELHIGGDGVARGYHERHELTAQRFVDRPGMGLVYATGDVVRINGDGIVEFAGRSDHQVKIRGHRIELGEIETVIDAHPDVVQSVVVAHRPPTGDPRLVAFVVTHGGAAIDEAVVRSSVGERLPDAYVPSRVVRLDALPLTPNGKTDRTRLEADLESHLAGAPDATVAPPSLDDATEQLVAEVWQAELRRSVGPDDNFFEIGGNSLLAVTVFRKLCDRTGAKLALTDVFRFPTVRTFAQHLARLGAPADAAPGAGEPASPAVSEAIDRGAMRRRALARRGG